MSNPALRNEENAETRSGGKPRSVPDTKHKENINALPGLHVQPMELIRYAQDQRQDQQHTSVLYFECETGPGGLDSYIKHDAKT